MIQRKALERSEFTIREASTSTGVVVLAAMCGNAAWSNGGCVPGFQIEGFSECGADVMVRCMGGNCVEDIVHAGPFFDSWRCGVFSVCERREFGENFARAARY